MVQTNFVTSGLYNQKFRIHGHLAHDISEANKLRWFIYLIEDLPCKKAIIGSTTKPTSRWSTHKSNCNNGPSNATGLSKHFTTKGGCPNDLSRQKETLRFTLIDFIDVSPDKLIEVNHEKRKGSKMPLWRVSKVERLGRQMDIEDGNLLWWLGSEFKGWGTIQNQIQLDKQVVQLNLVGGKAEYVNNITFLHVLGVY